MTENSVGEGTPIRPEDVTIESPLPDTEGVKHSIALKIEAMLKQGRRYFGSSGAAMTQQAYNPEFASRGVQADKAKEYLEGERDTTALLRKWVADKPGAVLVDSVRIPHWDEDHEDPPLANEDTGILYGGDTDHVLLIGSEVILIDTLRWKKKKNYSLTEDGDALMTNKPFPEGSNITMKSSLQPWLDYLDEDAYVTGMVCVNAEEVTVLRNKNWYTQTYRLVELDRFEQLLNDKWKIIEEYDRTHINSTLVSQMVVCCVKPFDPYSRVFDMKTLSQFR